MGDQLRPFQRAWTHLKGRVTRNTITFTCEATRWAWVGPRKRKSEAKDRCLLFLKWVKIEGFKTELLNSDSGGGYTASENAMAISDFQKASEELGVKKNVTCAHTPDSLNRTRDIDDVLLPRSLESSPRGLTSWSPQTACPRFC